MLAITVVSPPSTATFANVRVVVLPPRPARVGAHAREGVSIYLDEDEAGACMLPDASEIRVYRQSPQSVGEKRSDSNGLLFERLFSCGIQSSTAVRKAMRERETLPRPAVPDYREQTTAVTLPASPLDVWRDGDDLIAGGVGIESSNRHIHLTKADVEHLYGKGATLTPARALQGLPMWLGKVGSFAAVQTVTVKNLATGAELPHVRVLGPAREYTQVELSHTDACRLGLQVPTRISSDTALAGRAVLVTEDLRGDQQSAELGIPEGVIRAARHVHMLYSTAQSLGVQHGSLMTVAVESGLCTTLLHDVSVRLLENGEVCAPPVCVCAMLNPSHRPNSLSSCEKICAVSLVMPLRLHDSQPAIPIGTSWRLPVRAPTYLSFYRGSETGNRPRCVDLRTAC
jgi:putative phosphotransacetylase